MTTRRRRRRGCLWIGYYRLRWLLYFLCEHVLFVFVTFVLFVLFICVDSVCVCVGCVVCLFVSHTKST
jgi:hypothetical protein